MPIRWRLTLWFSLILLCILTIAGIIGHTFLQSHLVSDIDDDLKVNSAKIHGTLHGNEVPEPVDYEVIHPDLSDVPINEFASPGVYIQLIDRNRNIIAKSDNLGDQELPFDESLIENGFSGSVDIATVSVDEGADLRIMVSPLFIQNETLLLEVGESLQHVDSVMSQLRWGFYISLLAALILAIVSGAVLAQRALAPVKKITATAESIGESSDLGRKVGYTGPMDEVGHLAATFDNMIEQLDKLFQSQKNFIADASHDLRSPLTVLQGNLDLLKRDMSDESKEESLTAMRKEIERMNGIVNDLLLLAEVESDKLNMEELVSLNSVMQEVMESFRLLSPQKNIVEGRTEDVRVKGNGHRLNQMLSNLVSNAVKHTSEDCTIMISLFRDGEWAKIEVADNGEGIASEHIPHLFDRFYRVNQARSRDSGSTGLGLAIVKEIAHRHGGTVTVESSPGNGSVFTVWLKI